MMSKKKSLLETNATLISRRDLSPTLAVFELEPDQIASEPVFKSGQYMVIGLNNEEHPELGGVRRAMSVASAPQKKQSFEFYIRRVAHPTSENPLTPLLWKCKTGHRFYLRAKGVGHLTLEHTVPESDPRMKIFVAAGTGLAPFLSIVTDLIDQGKSDHLAKMAVLHGASYAEELGFCERLQSYQTRYGLKYLPTVSRPKPDGSWKGATGRVEDFFLQDRIGETESALGLEAGMLRPEQCGVLICGLNGTISTTIERLLPLGFEPDHRQTRQILGFEEESAASLFYEKYDAEPLFNADDPEEVARLRSLIPARSRGQ